MDVIVKYLMENKGDQQTPGAAYHIAKALGISKQAVFHWERVPEKHVIDVEEITGIPRHVLRPDLYSENPS